MGILVFPALMRRRSGYLYNYGSEGVTWVKGYDSDDGNTFNKAASKIELVAASVNGAEIAVVTDSAIDLTGIDTVKFYVNRGYSTNDYMHRYFIASTSKTGGYDTYNVRDYVQGGMFYYTATLDVSGLSGSYYLRAHARTTILFTTCVMDVLQVWTK